MDGEFDEHHPLGNPEHLGTNVDDAPAEFETEVRRAATPNLDERHRDWLEAAFAKMEQIVLAKFCDPHIGAPQLGLHDVRVEVAQASREFPLRFRWIGLGET